MSCNTQGTPPVQILIHNFWLYPKLRLRQASKPLDPATTGLRRFMAKMFPNSILYNSAHIRLQAPEILNGLGSQYDLMAHSSYTIAR